VANAMSALSLSHEGPGGGGGGVSRSEGEESEVFPLVVVRVLVLQVSYCLFKSMCRVCPSIGTDAESCAAGWQASCRNSSRVRLPPLSGVAQRSKLMMLLVYVATNLCHQTNLCRKTKIDLRSKWTPACTFRHRHIDI
jgi:hypothetical protein